MPDKRKSETGPKTEPPQYARKGREKFVVAYHGKARGAIFEIDNVRIDTAGCVPEPPIDEGTQPLTAAIDWTRPMPSPRRRPDRARQIEARFLDAIDRVSPSWFRTAVRVLSIAADVFSKIERRSSGLLRRDFDRFYCDCRLRWFCGGPRHGFGRFRIFKFRFRGFVTRRLLYKSAIVQRTHEQSASVLVGIPNRCSRGRATWTAISFAR